MIRLRCFERRILYFNLLNVPGYLCECGIRGAYCEVTNVDSEVKSVLQASIAAKLCPTVLGQVSFDFEFEFILQNILCKQMD